ncbi:MAG: hypothetical protein IPN76_20290 [Saprospiraceae bacterium]|nr:hypothetical protein [Saprospiraceae bacterium]
MIAEHGNYGFAAKSGATMQAASPTSSVAAPRTLARRCIFQVSSLRRVAKSPLSNGGFSKYKSLGRKISEIFEISEIWAALLP